MKKKEQESFEKLRKEKIEVTSSQLPLPRYFFPMSRVKVSNGEVVEREVVKKKVRSQSQVSLIKDFYSSLEKELSKQVVYKISFSPSLHKKVIQSISEKNWNKFFEIAVIRELKRRNRKRNRRFKNFISRIFGRKKKKNKVVMLKRNRILTLDNEKKTSLYSKSR